MLFFCYHKGAIRCEFVIHKQAILFVGAEGKGDVQSFDSLVSSQSGIGIASEKSDWK